LGLDAAATHALEVVIEKHLVMASVSQRRDLDDPAVIHRFAKEVENPEILSLLTIHTFVDALATSDKLWNGFKDSLLWILHHKTMQLMAGGTDFVHAEEKHRDALLEEVRARMPDSLSEEELLAHFGTLPPRYFQVHSVRDILDDLIVAHRFMRLQISEEDSALAPVVNWHNEPDRGYSAVKICTWDRARLFSKIAGSLSASGLNILTAQIFTRSDGIVLDTFFVTDARTGNLAGAEQRDRFEAVLNKALTGEDVAFESLIAEQKITRPAYHAYTGERIVTQVRFDNETSESRTVIEIESEDRIGLLYAISQALSEVDVDIAAAKILTEKGAAIDTFYARELDRTKITGESRQRIIEKRLRQAIHALDKIN